jgi:acyl-homoserine lactone acylase PvdQ
LESKTLLENYANGVNKVIENVVLYPVEFNLMWSTPEPWKP